MTSPNGGFTYQSREEMIEENMSSKCREQAEDMTLGDLVREKRMEQMNEIKAEMDKLKESFK